MGFRFPQIDAFSFWLGVLLTSFTWLVVLMLRPVIQNVRLVAQDKRSRRKENVYSVSGFEERYLQSVLKYAQGLHLASPLFSLDEIVIPPLLLAPPPRIEPGSSPPLGEDIASTAIPYLPAWPQLASIYNAPTLTLFEALSGKSDLVLTGQTGMGKTVAMAYLASRLAMRDPAFEQFQNILPFIVHVSDLDFSLFKDEPLDPLIEALSFRTPVGDLGRLRGFVRKVFSEGRAILMLDGTDELTPVELKNTIGFIKVVKHTYPDSLIVTASSGEFLDGLVTLNFIPLALAAWSAGQRRKFLDNWADHWTDHISIVPESSSSLNIEYLLRDGWLNVENGNLTPLEYTLKTWGAFAGDIRGPSPLDAIETHLLRLCPDNIPRDELELLSQQVIINSEPFFDLHTVQIWFNNIELSVDYDQSQEIEGLGEYSMKLQTSSNGLIGKLVESGLLIPLSNNRFRFVNPVFAAYMAGKAMPVSKMLDLFEQPSWIGKQLAMQFKAAFGDVTPLVDKLFSIQDRPLSRNLLTSARWLRDGLRSMAWHSHVVVKLVDLLRETGQPLGLRGQALCALLQSGDPSLSLIFHQLIKGPDHDLIQMAALGLGALQDARSMDDLSVLIGMPSSNLRGAACLALMNIGTTAALDLVASALLHGDENLRRIAAEALSNHPAEGYLMLKEGASMKEDLMVRRSSAYGLGRIHEAWAVELVKRMETEDDQWAVRNAAMEVNEACQNLNPRIPHRLPPPAESSWFIAFAGRQGLGVSPVGSPVDLLLLALRSGSEEERLASLAYLRMLPEEGVFGALYQSMYAGDPVLREAVFNTFSEMAARGVDVPDPVQFGVGY